MSTLIELTVYVPLYSPDCNNALYVLFLGVDSCYIVLHNYATEANKA